MDDYSSSEPFRGYLFPIHMVQRVDLKSALFILLLFKASKMGFKIGCGVAQGCVSLMLIVSQLTGFENAEWGLWW